MQAPWQGRIGFVFCSPLALPPASLPVKVAPLTLRAVLVTTACLAPVVFGLSAFLLQSEFREGREIRAQLNQSYETRLALQNLLTLHLDLETAHRGFIISNNSRFLEPSRDRENQIEQTFSELAEAITPSRDSMGSLEALRSRSIAKRQFIAEGVELARAGDQEGARSLIAQGRGKELMDGIRLLVAGLEAQERARLEERISASEQSRYRLRVIFLAANTVLSVLLLIAAVAGLRMNRARQLATEQLREAVAKQDAVFNNAPDGLILLDGRGRIEHLNPCAEAMFDYDAASLQNHDVGTLLQGAPSTTAVTKFLRSLQSGMREGNAPREFDAVRKDGSHFPVEVMTSNVSGGDEPRYLAVVRDVTQRKQIEKMKNEFISVVSHELRTPLTSIAGSLGLLAAGAAGKLPERAGKLVNIAHSNSIRLVRLVNDILDMEKLQAGMLQVALDPVELAPLIEQTVQQNLGFAGEFGVRIEVDPVPPGLMALADEDRLIQVLTNLLSNAIKFSPRGDVVRVTCLPMGERVRISVADRGPGIPEEFGERIFQKFVQVDSSDTRKKGGTGLGLTITSEIVSRLKGRLSFESTVGSGTTFHVDLLRAGAEGATAEDQPAGR